MHPFIRPVYAGAGRVAEVAAASISVGPGKLRRSIVARKDVVHRFERWARTFRDVSQPLIWLHAPSVGEGLQARPVLDALKAAHPRCQFVYTFFSPSAESFAETLDVDFRDVLPFDTARAGRAILEALRPEVIIFSKLDVWPNLVDEAHARRVPTALISATLTARSSRNSRVAALVLRDSYSMLSAVGAISAADGARLVALGCRKDTVHVTGDTRFDQVASRALGIAGARELLDPLRSARLTLVAGSTWPSDERVLLAALADPRVRETGMRLIIAPHEPTPSHLAPIEQWAVERRLRHARITDSDAGAAEVLVVDRLGVLGDIYALGDIAFVGGGFHAAGLHSVLEPASYGVPVLFGHQHANSRDAALLIDAGGACEARDAEGIVVALCEWFGDPVARRVAGRSAQQVIMDNSGATARTVALIESIIPGVFGSPPGR